jgi:hypothetical protein
VAVSPAPGRRPARPRSTATAANVEGFAKLFADDLKSGADDGVVSQVCAPRDSPDFIRRP